MIAGLGRDVGGVGDLADRAQSHHGRDVDDRASAVAVRPHVLGREAAQPEGRGQVEVQNARERLGRRSQRGRGGARAGVVDEAVEAAVTLDHGLDEPLAIVPSVTSQVTVSAPGISSRSEARRSARRAAMTGTRAGARSARASCSPRPELAPVTMTTWPSSAPSSLLLLI